MRAGLSPISEVASLSKAGMRPKPASVMCCRGPKPIRLPPRPCRSACCLKSLLADTPNITALHTRILMHSYIGHHEELCTGFIVGLPWQGGGASRQRMYRSWHAWTPGRRGDERCPQGVLLLLLPRRGRHIVRVKPLQQLCCLLIPRRILRYHMDPSKTSGNIAVCPTGKHLYRHHRGNPA